MTLHLGKVKPGATLYIPFDTFAGATGASITMSGLLVSDIEVYRNGSVTQRASDTGYTLLDTDGIDFDGITGIHGFSIDLSSNATADFFTAGAFYWVVVSAVTVDSQTVSFVAATFQIGYEGAILDTTIATLSSQTSFTLTAGPAEDDALNGCEVVIHDIASAVQAGRAFISDYTGSTRTVTLVAGTTFTAAAGDNISVFLSALQPTVQGRALDVSAGGEAGLDWANIGSPTTAQNLSATNIDVDQVVASVSGAVGSVTGSVGGNVTGSVGSIASGGITAASIATDAIDADALADGAITAATFAAGAIDNAAIAADAIGSSELAASAITEIQSGLATAAALADVQTDVDAILVDTGTTIPDLLGTPAGASISADIAAIEAQTDDIGAAGAGLSAIPWNAAWDAEVQSEVADALAVYDPPTEAEMNARTLAAASYATAAALATVDTVVDAIQVVTDRLADTLEDSGGGAYIFTEAALAQAPSGGLTAQQVADAVWDEPIASHADSGSTGEALAAAGGAGDPWITALPGAYGAGTAGNILGNNLNATVSSRLASASYTAPLDAAGTRSAIGLASANLDTQLDALPTAAENADAVWDEDATGHQTQGTFGQAVGDPGSDSDSIWALANTNLDAAVSTRLATASYTTPPTVGAIADQVWDEATAGHTTSGTFGEQVKTDIDAILVDTAELQTDWADGGRLDVILDARASQTSVNTIDDLVDDLESRLTATRAGYLDNLSVGAVAQASGVTVTTNNDKTGYALTNTGIDAIFDRTDGVESGWTLRQALRIMAAALAGELAGAATTTITIRNITDTKARITATVDADGNRTALTLDGS